jgi:hypothetical protein
MVFFLHSCAFRFSLSTELFRIGREHIDIQSNSVIFEQIIFKKILFEHTIFEQILSVGVFTLNVQTLNNFLKIDFE